MNANPTSTAPVEQHPGLVFAEDLRKLADLLDEHPELAGPFPRFTLNRFVHSVEELRELIRTVGGEWHKTTDDHFLMMRRVISDSVYVDVNIRHEEACERVVVATETVTREVPDPELVAEVPTVIVTEEVEKVEWVCPPSLLRDSPPPEPEYEPIPKERRDA